MGLGESNGSLGGTDGMRARLAQTLARESGVTDQTSDIPSIPDLELLRCIGRGSYGEVWLARNILATYRAVKIVNRRAFRDEAAFEREFLGLQQFEPVSREHNGFVAILHVGRDPADGFFYYVMELADDDSGGTEIDPDRYVPKTLSSELARRGRLLVKDAARLGSSLSDTLERLHRHGLVHRDIKPSNIIFVKDQPKLADIGLVAKTGEKAHLGTEGYIAPEGPGTPQADVYSLGKVLYEVSTGTDRLNYPDLPPDVDTMPEREAFLKLNTVILKACENDIRNRHQTASEINEDLKPLGSGIPAPTMWTKLLRNPAAIVSAVLLCVLVLAFSLYRLRHPTASTTPEKSIAVLPLDNLSDEKQNAYFVAGVQDEITTNLARIAELKVISRTSANLYKIGNPRNSREIGQQLGVAHLLEGSVQRIGNRIRVNAQLIKTDTDEHIWAQIYDRDVSDLFAIQSEIAQTIAGQLYAKISPAEKQAIERPPTSDLTAFDLYTQAKDLAMRAPFTNTGKKDLLQAADLLNQALVRDPSFFQAYCQLAQAHDALYFFGFDRTPERLALAEAALAVAFRLQPDSGEAHLARAWNLYHGYLDYDGALAELQIAGQTLPNNARVFELTGNIRRRQGHWTESVQNYERALDLDPRDAGLLQNVANSYQGLRRYAESAAVWDRVLSISPDDVDAKIARALIQLDWKADTRPLHQTIESIQQTNPTAIPSVADRWFMCALAERDMTAATNALAVLGENTFGIDAVEFRRSFGEGLLARMRNDDALARSAFAAARRQQEKIVDALPDYGPTLCVLGLIDAGLGRKEDALREGRHAIELLPVEKDAINGPLLIGYSAALAAWVGENDLACEQLATAIQHPSSLSYGKLKLLPFWDPLRGNPQFEKIVASLAPK